MPRAVRSWPDCPCRARLGTLLPLSPCRRGQGPNALEFGRLGGALEHLLAGDAFAQDLAAGCLVADAVHPPPTQLERRHVERLGDAVDLHLGGELGLRRAEAAEGAVGRRVGRHRPAVDAHVGTRVGPCRVKRAA